MQILHRLPRRQRHDEARVLFVALALAVALTGSYAASALAGSGSGDFTGCGDVWLSSATTCWGPSSHTWVETEGSSADDQGTSSCTGDGTGSGNGTASWYDYNCDSSDLPSGANAVYCTSACDGDVGHGFVHDHSANADYFTGWGEYSS